MCLLRIIYVTCNIPWNGDADVHNIMSMLENPSAFWPVWLMGGSYGQVYRSRELLLLCWLDFWSIMPQQTASPVLLTLSFYSLDSPSGPRMTCSYCSSVDVEVAETNHAGSTYSAIGGVSGVWWSIGWVAWDVKWPLRVPVAETGAAEYSDVLVCEHP